MQSLYNLYKVIIMLDEKVAKGEDLQANKINGLCIPKQVWLSVFRVSSKLDCSVLRSEQIVELQIWTNLYSK